MSTYIQIIHSIEQSNDAYARNKESTYVSREVNIQINPNNRNRSRSLLWIVVGAHIKQRCNLGAYSVVQLLRAPASGPPSMTSAEAAHCELARTYPGMCALAYPTPPLGTPRHTKYHPAYHCAPMLPAHSVRLIQISTRFVRSRDPGLGASSSPGSKQFAREQVVRPEAGGLWDAFGVLGVSCVLHNYKTFCEYPLRCTPSGAVFRR
jgi:hypothetical protein